MDATNKPRIANANKSDGTSANDLNAAVLAALGDIHAAQARLARGDVPTRPRSPPKHAEDASAGAHGHRAASPPRTAGHRRAKQPSEPRRREIVWVSKPLQRWRADGSLAEPLGTLEFLRGATLADARALVDQFYPLPHKRAYVFYHPTRRVAIEEREEASMDAAGFEVLAVVALRAPVVAVSPQLQVEDAEKQDKVHAPLKLRAVTPSSGAKPSQTADVAVRRTATAAASRSKPTKQSTEPGTQVVSEPEYTQMILRHKALGDGVVCDVVIRESLRDGSVAVTATVVEGEFAGRSAAVKVVTRDIVDVQALQRSDNDDSTKTVLWDALIRQLHLHSREVEGSVELFLVLEPIRRRDPQLRERRVVHVHGPKASASTDRTSSKVTSVVLPAAVAANVTGEEDRDALASGPQVETQSTHVATVRRSLWKDAHGGDKMSPRNTRHDSQEPRAEAFGDPPGSEADDEIGSTLPDHYSSPDQADTTNDGNRAGAVAIDARHDKDAEDQLIYPSRHVLRTREREHEPVLSSENQLRFSQASSETWDDSVKKRLSGLLDEGDGSFSEHAADISERQVSPQPPLGDYSSQYTSLSEPHPSGLESASEPDQPVSSLAVLGDSPTVMREDAKLDIPAMRVFPPAQRYAKVFMDCIVDLYNRALLSDPAFGADSQPVGQDDTNPRPAVDSSADAKVEVLISHTLFRSAFQHYGLDHSLMALNGVLCGITEEFLAWSKDSWEEALEALVDYAVLALSRVPAPESTGVCGGVELRSFEAVLNFVADFLGWTKVTACRLQVIEKSVDGSFQNMAEVTGKRAAFKLSDNERSLLSRLISSIATDTCTELERWLADGLEVLYFLVQKHFITLDDTKLQLLPTRELRVKWIIQKMVTLDPSAWRRMELFFYPTVEDYTSWSIIGDRLRTFRRDRQLQSKLLDSDVFLNAFVRFLHNKMTQVSLSISEMLAKEPNSELTSSLIQRYTVMIQREVARRSWTMSSLGGFLQTFAVKVCELGPVNDQRKAIDSAKLNVDARQSLHTTHQTRLLASVYGLYKKPRWDQPDMASAPTHYTFHGDASIALEYVYVHHSVDLSRVGSRWEDELRLAEREAAAAFHHTYTATSTSRRPNVICALGLNALHSHWLLEKMDLSSPKAVSTHPSAHSLSIGFHLSRNEDISAIRVTIRIHVATNNGSPIDDTDTFGPTHNAIAALNRFICSASEEALYTFVSMGGLRFLAQCLPDQRDTRWKSIPYGLHFSSTIAASGLSTSYPRSEIVFFLQSLVPLISRTSSTVSPFNLALLATFVKCSGSQVDEDLADAVVRTLISLANPSALAGPTEFIEEAFQSEVQEKFLAIDGLSYLKSAMDVLPPSSRRRTLLEDALCLMLTSSKACSLGGFLVHSPDWTKYFVEPESWTRSPVQSKLLELLLDRLHTNVFSKPFVESERVHCDCGCRGLTSANGAAYSGVINLLCALLSASPGRQWGWRDMKGPLDLLMGVEWTTSVSVLCDSTHARIVLFATLFDMMMQVAEDATMCVDACCVVVPRLLQLVASLTTNSVQVMLLQLCGLLLEAAVKRSLWKTSPTGFFQLCVALSMAIVSTRQRSIFTEIVLNAVFHEDRSQRSSDNPPTIISLLCEEHTRTTSGQQRTSSILQSLVFLLHHLSNTEKDVRAGTVPLLIAFTTLFGSSAATQILVDVGVEAAFHELLSVEDAIENQVLVGRAFSAFYVQVLGWDCWKPCGTVDLSRFFTLMMRRVRIGTKASHSSQRLNTHFGDHSEPLFGAEVNDMAPVMAWYGRAANPRETDRQDPSQDELYSRIEGFWEHHEWHAPHDGEVFLTYLKLLVVSSTVFPLSKFPTLHSDLGQVLLFVLTSIRDRSHMPEPFALLYVVSLENLATELCCELPQMGLASTLDTVFFERLLVYSRRPTPLLARSASRALWVLTTAFQDRDVIFQTLSSVLHLGDEDQATTQKKLPATTGVDIILGTITRKLATYSEVEGDAATLALLLELHPKSVQIFFATNRYSTVLKLLADGKVMLARGPRSSFLLLDPSSTKLGCVGYDIPTSKCERDVIQLSRLARSCLLALARSDSSAHSKATQASSSGPSAELPYKLGDELNNTKRVIVPLLRDEHPLIVEIAARCILLHLKSEPQRSTEIMDPQECSRLLTHGLDCDVYAPLQAASLAVLRVLAGDQRAQERPYRILDRLLEDKARLILCLRRRNFDVMKQTVEILAHILAKMEDPSQRSALANAFQEATSQDALSSAFSSLCGEFSRQSDAPNVLQRLVGFVIQLDLVTLIDGDNMVEAMCVGIASHKGEGFLLPMICNCLYEIATQKANAVYFAKKGRLESIVSLLNTSLTNGEAWHIGATLRALASSHSGIRNYLSRSGSDCLGGIVRVLGSFSRASAENVSSPVVSSHTLDLLPMDDAPMSLPTAPGAALPEERHLLRMSIDNEVVVSIFTDEVYEEFLGLLLVLLEPLESAPERFGCMCSSTHVGCSNCDPCDMFDRAGGPRIVTRFLLSRRIFTRLGDTNQRMVEATSSEAFSIVHLALQTLQILSRSHRCRMDILGGSARSDGGWWSIMWLIERARSLDSMEVAKKLADIPVNALMILGHCAAVTGVVDFILKQRDFLISLFAHIRFEGDDAHGVRCQRSASFLIARLAEYRKVARDLLFKEKSSHQLKALTDVSDRVVRANLLILARNLDYQLPNDTLLSVVVAMLKTESGQDRPDRAVLHLVCDVLTHLFLIRRKPQTHPPHSTAAPNIPGLGLSGSSLVGLTRTSMTPVWRAIVATFDEEDDSAEYRILISEVRDLSMQLWPSGEENEPLEVLLNFLLKHHLPNDTCTNAKLRTAIQPANTDEIPLGEGAEITMRHQPSLQYVNSTVEQNAPFLPDLTFQGSIQLWRLVQLLWRYCASSRVNQKQRSQLLPMNRIIAALVLWGRVGGSDSLSTLSLERRQRLLKFVNEILRSSPEYCGSLLIDDIVSMLEVFSSRSGSTGVGFELLFLMCSIDTSNANQLARRFAQVKTEGREIVDTRMTGRYAKPFSSLVHVLWNAARAGFYYRAVPTARVVRRSDDSSSSLHVLEPYVTSSSTGFAMALLDMLSDSSPETLIQYLSCQSVFALLELLLVTVSANDSASRSRHTLNERILRLVRKIVEVHPNTVRFFRADPRLLLAVQRLVFSVKIHTQLAAVELLSTLTTKDSSTTEVLYRLEDWTSSSQAVHWWMVDAIEDHLTRLRLSVLSRKDVVEVAHLVQVPVFASVKTADLARLSVSFMESRLAEEGSFMVLSGVGTFNSPPLWMCETKSSIVQSSEVFTQAIEARKAKGLPVLLYKMQKDWYVGGSTMVARHSISREIASHHSRVATSVGHSTPLANRLCRFLVEDRAELLRRVTFTKHISSSEASAGLHHRWNDTLGLLANSPIMEGVSRDSIACLAYAMLEPTFMTLTSVRGGDPLILVYTEGVRFEATLLSVQEEVVKTKQGEILRGDMFGCAWSSTCTVRFHEDIQVLAAALPEELLRSELQPSEFELVRRRCEDHFGKDAGTKDLVCRPRSNSQLRVTLQLQSLALMKTLVDQSQSYSMAIAANDRVISTLSEVARSHLHPSLVDAAISVLIPTLTNSKSSKCFTTSSHPTQLNHHPLHEGGFFTAPLQSTLLLLQDAVREGRRLQLPLQLLRSILRSAPARDIVVHIPDLLTVLSAILTESKAARSADLVDELSLVLLHLVDVSPQSVHIHCKNSPLHLQVTRLLSHLLDSGKPQCYARLLRLVSFFDNDSHCHDELHDAFLQESMRVVVQKVTAELYVESQLAGSGSSLVTTYLHFIDAYCQHVVRENAMMKMVNPDHEDTTSQDTLQLTIRVVLDGLSGFAAQHSLALRVIAHASEATITGSRLTATCTVQDGQRRVTWHRWIFQRFQEHPSSHTGSMTKGTEELLYMVSCIRALSSTPQPARHFVKHGFTEIAFRYLLHRPSDVIKSVHIRVWTELLQALRAISSLVNEPFSKPSLLQSHGEKLRTLHTHLIAITTSINSLGESIECDQLHLVAAYIDLLSGIVETAEVSGVSLEEMPWLSVEVASQCFRWIQQSPVQAEATKTPLRWQAFSVLKLPMACLRFLSLLCSSPVLAMMKTEQPLFPEALKGICNHASVTHPTSLLFDSLLHYLCLVVELLVERPLPHVRAVLPSTLHQVGDMVARASDVCADAFQHTSKALDLSIRLAWLVVVAWRKHHVGNDNALELSCRTLLATLSRLHEGVLKKHGTMVNVLGLLSAITRVAVSQPESSVDLREAVVASTFELLTTNAPHTRESIDESTAACVDWKVFSTRRWDQTTDAMLELGIDSLFMATLQRVIADASMQRQWLLRDEQLATLTRTGLPLAVRLLTVRHSNGLILSARKHTQRLLRVVIMITQHLRHTDKSWRRALRKAAFVDVAARFLADTNTPDQLKLETIHLLTALATNSAVDAIACTKQGGPPFVTQVAALAIHSKGPELAITCLNFLTTVAGVARQSAAVVTTTLQGTGGFIQAMVSKICHPLDEHDALLASLMACCRALVLHGPFAEAMFAAAAAMTRLSGAIKIDEGTRSVAIEAVRLFDVLWHSDPITMQTLLDKSDAGEAFWQCMRSLIKLDIDRQSLQAAFAFWNRSIRRRLSGGRGAPNDIIEAVLLQALAIDDELGSALCVEWLLQPQLLRGDSFVRTLCSEMTTLSTRPALHQRGLVRVLPTLVSILERGRVKYWLSEDAWMEIRDVALTWSTHYGQKCEFHYCGLSAFSALLKAKQLRVLHEAARAFRRTCRLWNAQFVASSTHAVMHTACEEVTVALGIQVLLGISIALGLQVDKDAIKSRVASLWLTTGFYMEPLPISMSSKFLELMLKQCVGDAEEMDMAVVELSCAPHIHESARFISRQICGTHAFIHDNHTSQRLAVCMLRSSTMRAPLLELMQSRHYDLVNYLGWASSSSECGSRAEIQSQCEILGELSIEAGTIDRIQKRRIPDRWIFVLTYIGDHGEGFYASETNRAFLVFAVMVIRHSIRHDALQLLEFSVWKPMILHCVVTLQQETQALTSTKTLALELLADLIQINDALLRELWCVCLLLSSDNDTHDRTAAQGAILRALTDPLRHASTTEDRRRAAFVSYSLATSLRRASPLVQARTSRSKACAGVVHSLCDQLTHALFMSAGTRVRRTLCVQPVDWNSESSIFPVSLTFVAADTATWVLCLLRKCLRDKSFVRGLVDEFDLFDQLFAAVASSNAEVASAAAWVLRDAALLQSTQRSLARLPDQLGNRQYRQLAFFSDLRAHDRELFTVLPRTMVAQALPARFAALEMWILFYSRRIDVLQSSEDARAHLEATEEVAMFMVSQSFTQIFTTDADDTGANAVFLGQATRERHTTLCEALLLIGCSEGHEIRRLRVLSVELLTTLCSSELTKFSSDLFLTVEPVAKLLGAIEQAESDSERFVVVRLLRELLRADPIRLLVAESASSLLLQQIVSWLDQPRFKPLRTSATAIIRQLVTKSPGVFADGNGEGRHRKRHAEQLHNMLMVTTKALFHAEDGMSESVEIDTDGARRKSGPERVDHTVTLTAEYASSSNSAEGFMPAAVSVSVLFHIFVRDRQAVCLREFRQRGKLRSDRRRLRYVFLLEDDAAAVSCDIVVLSQSSQAIQKLVLKTRSGPSKVSHNELLQPPPAEKASVSFTLSHSYSSVATSSRGVLGRLLVDPSVPAQVYADALAIITELSKSASIFSSPQLQLDRHIIAAMEANQRLNGRLDLSPLNALTAWFWTNRSSVAHFRSSWEPLLTLVRRMRSATFLKSPLTALSGVQETAAVTGPTFLASLMEWLATLESDSLTENCLNALFFENGDVLVRLASHVYPHRNASANFLSLVAMAVRVNRLHCEVFARTHALATMTKMLDDLPSSIADRQAETLQLAARVVAKIARVPTAADKFLRHGGMLFFGKIAFHVLGDLSDGSFVKFGAAAQNLVLASSFLCERTVNASLQQSERPSGTETLTLLITRPSPEHQTLSLVETLLLFLARAAANSKHLRSYPVGSSSSYERLAAIVIRAWIEKWPASRGAFESVLFASADFTSSPVEPIRLVDDYAKGMCRCIQLTRWDFYSELNVVARTFSAAISAGVRTGVIPLKCRNVFLPFDSDFLETQRMGLAASKTNSTRSNTAFSSVPSDVVHELRDVLRFVADHTLLAQTLSENRKKTLTSRIKVAESSARVATGFHMILVVAYDTFIDALATVEDQSHRDDASRVILQWLTLLEELGGLLCCGFQELDPTYYEEIFRQMHSLMVHDFPAFMLKMEAVQSREETVAVTLNNMERLLRRLASKHELRGVTSLGVSVAEHAEQLLTQYTQTKDKVSGAIALALSGRDAVNRVQRGIVAAEYAWRRVFGVSGQTIASYMAGTEESESLWVKISRYADAFRQVVQHPGPLFRARMLKLQALAKSLGRLLDSSTRNANQNPTNESPMDPVNPSKRLSIPVGNPDDSSIGDDDGGGENVDIRLDENERSVASSLGIDASMLLVSTVPFTGLESLLDHYGIAFSGIKKQIALLNFEGIAARVVQAFAEALSCDVATVKSMSAAELEKALAELHGKCLNRDEANSDDASGTLPKFAALLAELQTIVDTSDLGIHLRVVVQRPVKQSLWQLLLAPVRRARLFSVYDALRRRDRTRNTPTQHVAGPLAHALAHDGMALKLPDEERAKPAASGFAVITETLTSGALFIKSSVLDTLSEISRQPAAASAERQKNRRIALANDNSAGHDPFAMLATETVSAIVVKSANDDPLSDEKLVAALKRKLRQRRHKQQQGSRVTRLLWRILPTRWRYATPPAAVTKAIDAWRFIKRRVALVLLLLAFWRQEELESDLTNPVLARAFASSTERKDYFVSTHLRKALDEFVRVWMPESGSLGLPIWQWKLYGSGGTMLSVLLAFLGPCLTTIASSTKRNDIMTYLTYVLVGTTLALCAASIHSITQKHFVLQERNRLRLQPLGKYYPNVIAIVTMLVEIVQLNSITFDPKFNWNETDQLPKLLTWLGKVGITQIGIQQVELKAALCAAALLVWFLLLKCANKFQESNPFLNRVVTKDLPGVLNGTLYMGLVATFFSFLSCVDCNGPRGSLFQKCTATTPPPAPFLLNHQSIPCWTATHAPLALLGFWGVTFFLPIGLLSQGMNQVLFQQEVLDIKYAPVVLLFSQLVKAVAATARALFPFDTTLLASVALAGNALLLVLILKEKGASLWYVQLIKGGIYAASGWSAACAIYRVSTDATSASSNNIVYMGWLAIGAVTVVWMRIWGWQREQRETEEHARHMSSQRSLLTASSYRTANALTSEEQKFVRAAAAVIARPDRRARTLLQQAEKFVADEDDKAETVPVEVRPLLRRAQAFASGRQTVFGVAEAVFTHNARKRAKKLDADATVAGGLRARRPRERDSDS